MAKTTSERVHAYRERKKSNNQKPVSFILDADIYETVASYAEQNQTTQSDVANKLLREVLISGEKNPIDEIVSIEEKRNRRAELLQVSTAILTGVVSNYQIDENSKIHYEQAVFFAKKLIAEVDKNV